MGRNGQLEAGLKRIAKDYHLPAGGRKKLSQLVAHHLYWFDAAERRGMGWRDMISALTAAGVTGKGGKTLSVGTLSSTVWRKRAEAGVGIDHAGRHTRLGSPESAAPRLRPPKKAKRLSAGQPQRRRPTVPRPVEDQTQPSRSAPIPTEGQASDVRAQNRDVLAFMDRARAVRRRSD
jgi:hypothetical protein